MKDLNNFSLSEELKNILDNMTQEDFDNIWSKITELKLEGPTFSEVIEHFSEIKNNNKK